MKKIIFILVFGIFPFLAWPDEFTLVYTGNSYANLYPCGHCPATVGGGIARMAAKINEIRNKTQNVILVDSGNFTASGALDEASINPEMDKARSVFYMAAMDKIGYDAAVLGEGEFNLGLDFVKKNIKKYKFKFISANVGLEGVAPYYIKQFEKLKVAVIGLSPDSIQKKTGLEVGDYEVSVKAALDKIKGKADFVILASALGDELSLSIAERFQEIKIILLSGNMTGADPYEKVGETIILRPAYRAQEIRMLTLDVKDNKIVKQDFKEEHLPLALKEDLQVKQSIPACFSETNCPPKEGLVVKCQNPGTLNAACVYVEPKRIDAILITDQKCPFCLVDVPVNLLGGVFPGLDFKTLDYRSKEANELIKKYSVDTLPFFILPEEIKSEKSFSKVSPLFTEKEGKLLLKKELAGLFLFLKRTEIPRHIDFFLNPYEKNATKVLDDLISFTTNNKIDFQVFLIMPTENTVGYPEEELKVALAVKKDSPNEYLKYLALRAKDIQKTSFMDSLQALGLDYKKIADSTKSGDMQSLIDENNKLIKELGVTDGNVVLINNNRIFKVFQIQEKDLKKFF